MPILTKDPPGVGEVVNRMIERYHGGLRDAGISIDILEARPRADDNGDSEAYALKLHGYPCQATIKVVSYKDRVLGGADALLTIDGDAWETLSDDERDALVDHELEHLELKTDRDGNVLRDDIDRPKLRIRLHDHQYGWFDSVARRHGKASLEHKQMAVFIDSRRQMWLPFESDEEAQSEARNNRRQPVPVGAEAEQAAEQDELVPVRQPKPKGKRGKAKAK